MKSNTIWMKICTLGYADLLVYFPFYDSYVQEEYLG